jgi:serine/threonine protein phosphatase PrpC
LAKTIALAMSHRGQGRRQNEDNLYFQNQYVQSSLAARFEQSAVISGSPQLYAIADGSGGSGVGDRASRAAMRAVDQQRRRLRDMRENNSVNFTDFARDTTDLANRAVCAELAAYDGSRAGTTFAFLLINQDTAYSIGLGDSRIYLFRDNELRRLTEDHISQLPDRHPLGRHLGFLVDSAVTESDNMTQTTLIRGDILLLATDGLTDILSDEQIAAELAAPAAFSQQIHHLYDQAVQRGSSDNVSLIGVRILDTHDEETPKRRSKIKFQPAQERRSQQGTRYWSHALFPNWLRHLLFFLLFFLLGILLGKLLFSFPAWLASIL